MATSTEAPATPAPAPAPRKSLAAKLAEVMGEVERVAKTGRNAFHNYNYATEADIVASVRGGLAERGVMLIPSVEKCEWSERTTKSGVTKIATLTVRFTFHDGDSAEKIDFIGMGQGEDASDKAIYKAMTGAEKYALLKAFLIPTGDDPEADTKPEAGKREADEKPAAGKREADEKPAAGKREADEKPAAGKREAPRNQAAKTETAKPEGQRPTGPAAPAESPEAKGRRIRVNRIWAAAQEKGCTAAVWPKWVENVLGKKKDASLWTVEDMQRLEHAFDPEPDDMPEPF